MLVLKRRNGECLVIADTIKVVVVEIGHGWVKLGVEADPSIPVHRQEVWEQIKEVRKPEAL